MIELLITFAWLIGCFYISIYMKNDIDQFLFNRFGINKIDSLGMY